MSVDYSVGSSFSGWFAKTAGTGKPTGTPGTIYLQCESRFIFTIFRNVNYKGEGKGERERERKRERDRESDWEEGRAKRKREKEMDQEKERETLKSLKK